MFNSFATQMNHHAFYSLATILFGTELLMDINHVTTNRKDIYSRLNNAAWPCTWIPVCDCNSISLNDMVPSHTWLWLSFIIWHINVIISYPPNLTAGTRLVPSQTFPQLPVLHSWIPNFICLFNRELFIAPQFCSTYSL
jgi:hypothetical protein